MLLQIRGQFHLLMLCKMKSYFLSISPKSKQTNKPCWGSTGLSCSSSSSREVLFFISRISLLTSSSRALSSSLFSLDFFLNEGNFELALVVSSSCSNSACSASCCAASCSLNCFSIAAVSVSSLSEANYRKKSVRNLKYL